MNAVVYSLQPSSRLEYIASTLLKAVGFSEVSFTADASFYLPADAVKVNYSPTSLVENELWIKPVSLLFEAGIKQRQPVVFQWQQLPCFFATDGGDFPFDVLAASFYLLSRYEEYLPHTTDMYGRFAHENSLAFQHRFLHLPLINLWLSELQQMLGKRFPGLTLHRRSFLFMPTYDIDIAWSYRHKGWLRNVGGWGKDLLLGNISALKSRLAVLAGKGKDPFDCYDWLYETHARLGLQPVFFFLLAQKNKAYDKNILPGKPALVKLIQDHKNRYATGIHPSWQSGDEVGLLQEEIALLQQISQAPVTQSRQHYIRMSLPSTYRRLVEHGIAEDYSMGYGSINGFRASYCLPFRWYDLSAEKTTDLLVHPFCYMEANSFYEQHYTAAQALGEMQHYASVVRQVNGQLITIWHNHFLGTDPLYAGWKEVYTVFLESLTV